MNRLNDERHLTCVEPQRDAFFVHEMMGTTHQKRGKMNMKGREYGVGHGYGKHTT